jgi:hypothetical protein
MSSARFEGRHSLHYRGAQHQRGKQAPMGLCPTPDATSMQPPYHGPFNPGTAFWITPLGLDNPGGLPQDLPIRTQLLGLDWARPQAAFEWGQR